MAQRDIEMQQQNVYVNGYPSLAAFIASDSDHSTAIYRGYHRLAARNLLYLEAELFQLERRQDELDDEDFRGDLSAKQYIRDFSTFNSNTNPRCKVRRELSIEIREKIKEYQEALVLREAVLKMSKPHRQTVETVEAWMNGTANGRGVAVLSGNSAQRLGDKKDLVALHTPIEMDWLSRFMRNYLWIFFLEGQVEGSLAYFPERRIASAVAAMNVVVAAVLLVGAIVTLYLVQDNNVRLGLIGAYTALFALSVGLLTNASRAELFGSTAAYAAVLVVFVSGNLATPMTPAKS